MVAPSPDFARDSADVGRIAALLRFQQRDFSAGVPVFIMYNGTVQLRLTSSYVLTEEPKIAISVLQATGSREMYVLITDESKATFELTGLGCRKALALRAEMRRAFGGRIETDIRNCDQQGKAGQPADHRDPDEGGLSRGPEAGRSLPLDSAYAWERRSDS